MNKEDYLSVIDNFIDQIEKDAFFTIILDGSVNNNEHIPYYSDIDLKLFIHNNDYNKTTFRIIRDAINIATNKFPVKLNAWTLTEDNFPFISRYYVFDFVRRYCLFNGKTLLGEDHTKQIYLADCVTNEEQNICISSILSFLIRLHRLLTNPLAITDVQSINQSFILQQQIAYFFHAIRYFNAFFGNVIASIENNQISFIENPFVNNELRKFSNLMYEKRNNFNKNKQDLNSTLVSLQKTTKYINNMLEILSQHYIDSQRQIFYG